MATVWRQIAVGHPGEEATEQAQVMREIETIELARSDLRAFAPLYEAYYVQVHGYCLRRLRHREAAADATAQVFARAIASLASFQQRSATGSSFRGWLFTIAHNIVIDIGRRTRHHSSLDSSQETERFEHSPWLHDPAPGPEALAVATEEKDRVRRLLNTLPKRQQRIVELRMSGLNGVEIAAALNMSHGAVKSAQFRAYTALRELLKDAPVESIQPTSGGHR